MMKEKGWAGTLESSDIYVELEPLPAGSGIVLSVSSIVYDQFGEEIEAVNREPLTELRETAGKETAKARGAVDCTIRARVETAVLRGKGGDR